MARSRAFLVDTQIFLWFLGENERLSDKIKVLLTDPTKRIFLSVATIWEVVIKKARKKLKTPANLKEAIEASGFTVLSIDLDHVLGLRKLPNYHQDPFDRILISQAKAENLSFITADKKIWKYDVEVVKA